MDAHARSQLVVDEAEGLLGKGPEGTDSQQKEAQANAKLRNQSMIAHEQPMASLNWD